MNDKFMVINATDEIVVGGFGNLKGNLGLLKYNKEDIRKMITENNNGDDNIRLINSLLQSLKELQEQLQQKEDIINKANNYVIDNANIYLNIYGEKIGFFKENDGKTPIELLKILDNKGE